MKPFKWCTGCGDTFANDEEAARHEFVSGHLTTFRRHFAGRDAAADSYSADALALLRVAVVKAGSIRAYARQTGVSPAHISDVLNGSREPGEKILGPLHLEKKVTRIVRYYRADRLTSGEGANADSAASLPSEGAR